MAQGARFTIDQLKGMGYDADGREINHFCDATKLVKNTATTTRQGNHIVDATKLIEKPATATKRQAKRSKAEITAEGHFKRRWPFSTIIPHGIKLAFGDGTHYTPDIVIYHGNQSIDLVEVKGGYRGPGWEQGHERYRRARDVYGVYFNFVLATVKGGKVTESSTF